ncbi:hypothetical protein ONE63_010944 [Megalurothrips usitatus]|uniref:Uncharacterized protein n=1 Tax=Megalurothrips usitatus TaxID=439358 RepID=A0AAV7XL47_9NEOP|nr:hypothetical protein ONE63_010944 [Megalurothrips usitatus]
MKVKRAPLDTDLRTVHPDARCRRWRAAAIPPESAVRAAWSVAAGPTLTRRVGREWVSINGHASACHPIQLACPKEDCAPAARFKRNAFGRRPATSCRDHSGHLVNVPPSLLRWILWHVQHLKSTSPHDASPIPSEPIG